MAGLDLLPQADRFRDVGHRSNHAQGLACRRALDHTAARAYPDPFAGYMAQAVFAAILLPRYPQAVFDLAQHCLAVLRMNALDPGALARHLRAGGQAYDAFPLFRIKNRIVFHMPVPDPFPAAGQRKGQPLLARPQRPSQRTLLGERGLQLGLRVSKLVFAVDKLRNIVHGSDQVGTTSLAVEHRRDRDLAHLAPGRIDTHFFPALGKAGIDGAAVRFHHGRHRGRRNHFLHALSEHLFRAQHRGPVKRRVDLEKNIVAARHLEVIQHLRHRGQCNRSSGKIDAGHRRVRVDLRRRRRRGCARAAVRRGVGQRG